MKGPLPCTDEKKTQIDDQVVLRVRADYVFKWLIDVCKSVGLLNIKTPFGNIFSEYLPPDKISEFSKARARAVADYHIECGSYCRNVIWI